ncbi:MAG: nucleotidyl transferase AbiEii/AbiGii toxin family protein [Bacteroidales bacterium]|nr:nucleotidyl transferase AbiEii/AbiGii toxin family protein [Bacteroidales bacterium]
MIDIKSLLPYYPQTIAEHAAFHKYILKEYIELLALEFLSQTPYASKIVFIGGTNLRIIHGVDRFSEDLDFDCKNLSEAEFIKMTDKLVDYLRGNGLQVELRDKDNPKLSAFRRNIYFPGLLFDMNLTGHREERFLMKIEAQDQNVMYTPQTVIVNRCGFMFPITVPSKEVLLSMKLSALLARAKGRDFYDTIFLWQQVEPDYKFLGERNGIASPDELKSALLDKLSTTDLKQKQRDFEHLLFNPSRCKQILLFPAFIDDKLQLNHK